MTQSEFSLPFASSKKHKRSDTLRIHLLWVMLKFIIGATFVYAAILGLSGNISTRFDLLYLLSPAPTCALLLIMVRRGHVQLSAVVFITLAWLIMFFGAVMAGGVQSPAFSGFMLPILLAGWLVGRRAGLVFAFLSALAGAALLVLYANGWIVARVENTDFSIWVSHLFFFCIASAVLYLSTQNSDNLLERLRHNEGLALEANSQLQAEIDARKEAETELRFQANVLSEVQDAIIVTDIDRKVLYWNQGAEQIYGLTRAQTLTLAIDEIFDFEKGNRIDNLERAEALSTTGSWQGEDKSFIRSTGESVDVETRIKVATMDETGNPSHVIVSARNIRERLDAQKALLYRTELQKLLTQLATRFIDLPTGEMDAGMTTALQMLCEFFQVERGVIGLFSADLATVTFEYEYCNKSSSLDRFQNMVMGVAQIPWTMEHLKRFETLLVPSVDDLRVEASADKAAYQSTGTKSFVVIPLVRHKRLFGILGYSSEREQEIWSKDMLSQMHVLSQIITNLFERRAIEDDLRRRDVELNALATQLNTLLDVDRAIFSAQSLRGVIAPALRRLFDLCNCKCTSILLIDDETGRGTYVGQYPLREIAAFEEPIALNEISDLDDLSDGIILLNGSVEDGPCTGIEQEIAAPSGVQAMGRIPLKTRGQLIGILYLGFETGKALEAIDIELVEGIATSLALAIANVQLYEQGQSHADELEDKIAASTAELKRQYHLQAALAQIELAINQPDELESVLEQIIAVTTQTLPADKGTSIVLWDAETEIFTVSATSVRDQKKSETAGRVRKQGGATRWILDHQESVIVADTVADPFGANSMIDDFGIGAYVGTPLLFEGQSFGVLYVLMSQPYSFSAEQIGFLETVARRAALAITKVRLFEQAQEAAAEGERKRLARELHDMVSQSLFSANLIAESLPLLMDSKPEMVRPELQNLHQLTRSAAEEMRMLLYELRPDELMDAELGQLIDRLTKAFTGRTRIPVETTMGAEVHFPPTIQLGIYRIIQETLNNIMKHARAKRVWLDMSHEAGSFNLCIRDDGRGFEPNLVPSGHMGLKIMQERAAEIDATLVIDSTINEGTVLTLYRQGKENINHHEQFEFDSNFAGR